MPTIDITSDPEALTMTVVAEFDAPVERLWAIYTDPRQLERFWGPPGWPATFSAYDLTVGGHAHYAMNGPRGELSRGTWEFLAIEEPHRLEVLDAFADESGAPIDGMPAMRMVLTFEQAGAGTRMRTVSHFTSVEALEQVIEMGVVEGTRLAMGQIERVLHDLREYSQGKGTQTEVLTDQHVRITRLVDGPRDLVWRAHTEPELMRQWLLGPDGWAMTECEMPASAPGPYRYAWAPVAGGEGEPFGFDGEVTLLQAPRRMVSTEHMTGTDYPPTLNDLQLYEEDGATLISLLIEYPDAATRDMVLATGMPEGMETSYARLERELLAV
ncbi:SRPBCC family protein [Agromyces sp. SYSU T00194]|uniref:SRPBCC family protein n=1 Tax=Agromyces chitinivorans TaxID=3158560 RepID=UPI0033958A2D